MIDMLDDFAWGVFWLGFLALLTVTQCCSGCLGLA